MCRSNHPWRRKAGWLFEVFNEDEIVTSDEYYRGHLFSSIELYSMGLSMELDHKEYEEVVLNIRSEYD